MIELNVIHTDALLDRIIAQLEAPSIKSTNHVFHDLMSCIIEQQIHYRSTKKIFARALERSGIELLTVENFHLLEKHGLSEIKLARVKYESIMTAMEYWSRNTLDFNTLSDHEVIKELSAIKGVGQWTIDMILLYTLNRPDVFPFDDFHLKEIMIEVYNLNPKSRLKAQMLRVAEKWGNQKSLVVLYLLEWKNLKYRPLIS